MPLSVWNLSNRRSGWRKVFRLTPELDQALHHGSSIGVCPAQSADRDTVPPRYVAKFSSSTDLYSVVKAEFIAMRLAALCVNQGGTRKVSLVRAAGKDVLLVERFDRIKADGGWQREVHGLGADDAGAR